MKRSLCILVFALVATTNLLAQTIETPICYAYLPGRESTLKYKFSYGDEIFYTNLRFIKGSQSVFKAGDKIVMSTIDGKTTTFEVTEEMLSNSTSDYLPFETSAEGLDVVMIGVESIVLIRDGKSYDLEQNKYFNTRSKKDARKLAQNVFELEKKRQTIKNRVIACGDVFPSWRISDSSQKRNNKCLKRIEEKIGANKNHKNWRENFEERIVNQPVGDNYPSWRDPDWKDQSLKELLNK